MLVAGMDMSSSSNSGSNEFMAIIIGSDVTINQMLQQTGFTGTHMNMISNKKKQDQIISRLNFDSNQTIAFCIRTDKGEIIDRLNARKKNKSKKKSNCSYNREVFRQLREKIMDFLYKHNCDLDDVEFQCDSDCQNFAKDVGMRYTKNQESAFCLSDIVAWANTKNKEPRGTIEMNLTDAIKARMQIN